MPTPPSTGLRQWIWRAFAQSALIPLLLVETLLICVYLYTNSSIRAAQIEHLREKTLTDLQSSAVVEARVIDEQLSSIDTLTELYRNLAGLALKKPAPTPPDNLALSPDGVRYSPHDRGGAAVFYANSTPAAQQDLNKIARLGSLDPLMKEFKEHNRLVAALYFNSWDSLNYIYPWFLTPDQYPHDMVIPDYNFYYLADARHNPDAGVVWTDVYLDPAGQGWMMSAIAPVYRGDFLEGVVGIDITVDGILNHIGQLDLAWDGYAVLVSKDLNIMALPEAGEAGFGLDELTSHSYAEAIRRELFKPADFNLAQRPDTQQLAGRMASQPVGVERVMLNGQPHLIAWASIPQTDWHLLTVAAEANVFAITNSLANRYQQIGYLLIAGLVLFYAAFFSFMWLRAQQLSRQLREPIDGIAQMMAQIGAGNWHPRRVLADIHELDAMAAHAADMGARLATSESGRALIQQRLELVLDSVTESIWERDYRGDTLKLRGRFCARFGLPGEIITEDEFLARIHPQDRARVRAEQQAAIHSADGRYASEYRFADTAGHYHWLLSRGRVLERDPDTGKTLLLAGTHMDINQLKQVEDELRQAMVEAQSASRAKSRFISSISHELRTPLNAIQGFTQLLQIRHPADADSSYLDEILTACRHLSQLMGDLLDLSGIQAETPQLDLQTVDIRNIMAECASMVGPEVSSHGLSLQLHSPAQPLWVQADPRRLRQVLLNLLSNAIKYNRPQGAISLSYSRFDDRVRLQVEDTGPGISPELQRAAFEPFERLGRENTAIKGTGIGLALCRELAALMHGQMGVSSAVGVGSTFWIELPLAAPAATSPAAPRRARVFYADADPASQQCAIAALRDLAEVEVCDDGALTLQYLLQAPPDLLLLAPDLLHLSGEQVLQKLRASPATRQLPVVMLSTPATAQHLSALDCQGLLTTPLDSAELCGLVSALLHGRHHHHSHFDYPCENP